MNQVKDKGFCLACLKPGHSIEQCNGGRHLAFMCNTIHRLFPQPFANQVPISAMHSEASPPTHHQQTQPTIRQCWCHPEPVQLEEDLEGEDFEYIASEVKR